MKIKIKQEITVDVVEEMNGDEPVSTRETFECGEQISDIDVFDTQDTVWGIQFGDGSVCYLPVECFEVII
jgi:hypothetical protein